MGLGSSSTHSGDAVKRIYMKNKWSNYALKDGKIEESYKRKHRDRSESRKTPEASCGDSHEQIREVEEEVGLLVGSSMVSKVMREWEDNCIREMMNSTSSHIPICEEPTVLSEEECMLLNNPKPKRKKKVAKKPDKDLT